MRGFLWNAGLAIGNNLIQCSTEPRATAQRSATQAVSSHAAGGCRPQHNTAKRFRSPSFAPLLAPLFARLVPSAAYGFANRSADLGFRAAPFFRPTHARFYRPGTHQVEFLVEIPLSRYVALALQSRRQGAVHPMASTGAVRSSPQRKEAPQTAR